MRQRAILFFFSVPVVSLLVISHAQEAPSSKPVEKVTAKAPLAIVPLVTLKPGETKELLFSTSCTVGVTRGGGFSLAEMIDGQPAFENSTLKGNRLFRKQGVTVSVPNFEEGTKFAASAEFAALKKSNMDAFKVTVVASRDAQPGMFEMHLVDATCAGHCKTDFRVVVLAP